MIRRKTTDIAAGLKINFNAAHFARLLTITLAFACTQLIGCGDGSGDQHKKSPVDANGCVEFRLGQAKLKVSAKYLKGASHTASGYNESANLWALLPNFEGYDKAVNHDEFTKVLGWGRRIYIDLGVRSRQMTVPKIVARNEEDPFDQRCGLVGTPYGMEHGLEYYKTRCNWDSVYLYREDGIPTLKLWCNEEDQGGIPGCQGIWDYNSQVAVHLSFKKTYLPQWRAIMKGVKAVLDGELGGCALNPPQPPDTTEQQH